MTVEAFQVFWMKRTTWRQFDHINSVLLHKKNSSLGLFLEVELLNLNYLCVNCSMRRQNPHSRFCSSQTRGPPHSGQRRHWRSRTTTLAADFLSWRGDRSALLQPLEGSQDLWKGTNGTQRREAFKYSWDVGSLACADDYFGRDFMNPA